MLWYNIAIKPLMAPDAYLNDETHAWLWGAHSAYDEAYSVATMYVCSVYWALSVMTNLKGLPAHESRECFHAKPYVENPLVDLMLKGLFEQGYFEPVGSEIRYGWA